ncbi:MAG: hypothetical protein KF724_01790 [Phycisphaeraceae bacterium]|nr:hypothetical protein [Phycisphaeraceae bacterium]
MRPVNRSTRCTEVAAWITLTAWSAATSVAIASEDSVQPPAPAATATVSIIGFPPQNLVIPGAATSPGVATYFATVTPPGSQTTVEIAMTADWFANPLSALSGGVTVKNGSLLSRSATVTVQVPLCPAIQGGSLVGGTATMTLITQAPGSMSCTGQTPIVRLLCNGAPAVNLFICPFALAISGPGELALTQSLGLPGPTIPGPPSVQTMGLAHTVTVSAGATTVLSCSFEYLAPGGWYGSACTADLDGNGIVNAGDLVVILSKWGTSSACPLELVGDLNGDGVVNGGDVSLLLSQWGLCPPS